tara:strand:+ start:4376 stop:4852 length:477 start_codon:yes stop_codon:yes gene_type:complete
MSVHMYIPAINPTIDEQATLINYYYANEASLHANTVAGLNFLLIDQLPSCLIDIVNKVNPEYFERIYYYSNRGNVARHADKRRGTVITIPLINKSNIPTSFDSGNVYYHESVLVNTTVEHWADNPDEEFRLFIQVELNEDHTFDEYIQLHIKNDLVNK